MNINSVDLTNKAIEIKDNGVCFTVDDIDQIHVYPDGACTLLCRFGKSYDLDDDLKSVLSWLKDTGINTNGKFSFKLSAVNPIWSYKGLKLGHIYDAIIKDSVVTLFEDGNKIATDVNMSLICYKVEF